MDNKASNGHNTATKIAVIDDSRFMLPYMEQILAQGGKRKIGYFPRIPDDLSTLSEYEVLIVDGDGIDNASFKNGIDFIEHYEMQGRNKLIVYHSGLMPRRDKAEMLATKGVPVCVKGSDPQDIVDILENCGL